MDEFGDDFDNHQLWLLIARNGEILELWPGGKELFA
jgi:hypothetical protein